MRCRTAAVGAGSGLGLATAYGIVTQNEGSISVYSEPGHGTTFRIYFPRLAGARAATPPDPGEASQEPSGGSETILLAEDDRGLRALVQLPLEDDGYSVLSAATPSEALAIAHSHAGAIDLLSTDEIVRRGLGPDVPFIEKPFTPDAFKRKVREVLRNAQARTDRP